MGPSTLFVLVSDRIYVAAERLGDFLGYLDRVAFLRCDACEDDAANAAGILIPDFSFQDPVYAQKLAAVERAADALAFGAGRRRHVAGAEARVDGIRVLQ